MLLSIISLIMYHHKDFVNLAVLNISYMFYVSTLDKPTVFVYIAYTSPNEHLLKEAH